MLILYTTPPTSAMLGSHEQSLDNAEFCVTIVLMKLCSICQQSHYGLGFCKLHYDRYKRHNSTDDPYILNFWDKVDKTETCWLWKGAPSINGYGRASQENKVKQAHRISYELEYGSIPPGLHIDHLCRIRLCVRPSHLEAVTQSENNKRTTGIKRGIIECHWCKKPFESSYPNRQGPRCCGDRQCKSKRESERRKTKKPSMHPTNEKHLIPQSISTHDHETASPNLSWMPRQL